MSSEKSSAIADSEVLESLILSVEVKLLEMLEARKVQVQAGRTRPAKKRRDKIAKIHDTLEQEKGKRDALILSLRRQYAACPKKSRQELEELLAENDELLETLKNRGRPD